MADKPAGTETPAEDQQLDLAPEAEGPKKEPVSFREALKEARERVDRGEPLVPAGETEEEAEEPAEGPEAEAAEEEEPEGGEEAQEGEEPSEAGEEEAPEEEPPAAGEEEAEEEEEEPEAEAEEEEEPAAFETVMIPPRNRDEEEIPVEVPAELADDFRRLRNGYMRGEDFRTKMADVQDARAEIDYVDQELEADPVGFIETRVKSEFRRDLLLNLLADDEVWEDEELQDRIRSWDHDPKERKLFKAETKAERQEKERELEQRRAVSEASRKGVREAAAHVLSLVPETMSEDRMEKFYALSLRRLGEHAYKKGSPRFTREEIIELLDRDGILDGFGIDPSQASDAGRAQRPSAAGTRGDRNGKGSGTSRHRARPAASETDAEEARATGKRLQEKSAKRKSAAAAAPAGAGAPAARVELPPAKSVKERIKQVRKVGGVGAITESL